MPLRQLRRRWRRRLERRARRVRAMVRERRAPRLDEAALRAIAQSASSRVELWTRFATAAGVREMAEIGVREGDFAAELLARCHGIERYYAVGAAEATGKPGAGKRVVLRGRTARVVGRIPDGTLDLAYVEGDHTLRGLTIDLLKLYPKVRDGGWIGGDGSAHARDEDSEPTLVLPFAVHFAEAVGAAIYALPHNQFLIHKRAGGRFAFVDFTGRDGEVRRRLAAP